MAEQFKETKAERAERLKREKNPWECLHEIREFAHAGHGAIPPEWLGTYFRFRGVYTQGDGAGVTGGKGGEGAAVPKFVPGLLVIPLLVSLHVFNKEQAGTLANLSRWAFLLTFAGVGLRTNFREMSKQGRRPFVVGALGEVLIAALTLGLVAGANAVWKLQKIDGESARKFAGWFMQPVATRRATSVP